MRSKGYVELKQKLSEAAAARREAAIYEHHMKGTDSEEVKSVSWPERVVENELNRPEDVLDRGVCGCAGCGVIVYCSRDCWQEYREVHKTTGACQTLRGVYPSLMKAFMTRGGKNPKSAAAKQSLLDSWSVKQWLRRTSEETAWDIQLLLLAALVMARCAKEGFASHMAEELTASPDTVNVGGIGETTEEAGCSITSELVTESIREDKGPSSRSATTGTAESLPVAVSIATDSAMPKEMETIRARRLRCGTALEILDAKAVEHERDADAPAPAPSQLYVVLKDRAVLRVSNAKEATNAIRDPCWTDVARLVTNLSVLNKDSRSSFRSYYRRFNELVLPWICGGGETDTIFSVTADFFDRLGAASQCNSFGLFDAKDIRIGVTLYPEASYFNHSCFPNLCRVTSRGCLAAFYALRAIRKGEPLTICYVDIQEASTAERRRNLLRSYRFFCQCGRCRGTTAPTTTSITTSSNSSTLMDIPLCDACDAHGYMCPVPPEASLCWGMDEVQERECTVCHRRVRWIHK
ncbi:putative SET and MYND domain-containing protein 3 [Trypanosoma grayi]|uniref:putative SET and MYND domain-containing protein 3 n=1 Tax=Trypanosoma grayi TaxID=71804 RepID=UPI0004F4A5E0|nr:putative SET and MYND domain-containing protein 3 [Trypanosoma grayi]KEG06076.1 putative SET and MYND domain-containing protein 3 [Trypanosoma grayi]